MPLRFTEENAMYSYYSRVMPFSPD